MNFFEKQTIIYNAYCLQLFIKHQRKKEKKVIVDKNKNVQIVHLFSNLKTSVPFTLIKTVKQYFDKTGILKYSQKRLSVG